MLLSVDPLIDKVLTYNPHAETKLLREAFQFASQAHKGQLRKSGESFMVHPLGAAHILADIHLDPQSIASALLHDVLEDSGVDKKQMVENFGEEIYHLVEGTTKLEKLQFRSKEEAQAENLRKMFLAMAKDIRVVIIKLADRLHNMRTLDHLSPEKQKEIAQETLEIYAPLANRLGIFEIKWELEDLSFKILELEAYADIMAKVAKKRPEREAYTESIIQKLQDALKTNGMQAEVKGRPKHFYSIYQKMKKLGKDVSELYDVIALRIIVNSVPQCYQALGIIHGLWKHIPGSFDDYVATPKSNMYQSVHTSVMGPDGDPIEVQIRTHEMHHSAEYGIAAHWQYKEGNKISRDMDTAALQKLSWLRQLWEWQKEFIESSYQGAAVEFMEGLKMSFFEDEVFVFTPKGDILEFAAGSTPVDFAYRIHTQVGHRCVGAKVNGKMVTLDSKLTNGDMVEIITQNREKPSWDWLSYVRTSAARQKIKHWFRQQNKEESIQTGKELLEREIRRQGFAPENLLKETWLKVILEKYHSKSVQDLFASIGYGDIYAFSVYKKLRDLYDEEKTREPEEAKLQASKDFTKPREFKAGEGIQVEGHSGILVRLAQCCQPLPGDEVMGYVTLGRGVAVHRKHCINLKTLFKIPGRMVSVQWTETETLLCPVDIHITSSDRVGLLNEITSAIKQYNINITLGKVRTFNSTAEIQFGLEVNHIRTLSSILDTIKNIRGVRSAVRSSDRAGSTSARS